MTTVPSWQVTSRPSAPRLMQSLWTQEMRTLSQTGLRLTLPSSQRKLRENGRWRISMVRRTWPSVAKLCKDIYKHTNTYKDKNVSVKCYVQLSITSVRKSSKCGPILIDPRVKMPTDISRAWYKKGLGLQMTTTWSCYTSQNSGLPECLEPCF